ncbi:hypothetical protein P175DRAFT_0506416 [Aspergillus ochraceoroseus IBT 24754]|uniref:Gamma interferon inducible lysosomal thiol reductase GILT n=1 Tax=Aspergillus ochraceoroseus IBT 24754 TaxID=1392256 RepID=A0A2T5M8J4_9EURO|nr:uncharacterized protein P175DRAFT_0506416 [Aspergillus ochraceoroseus IBT 24754]PTU24851.1 hypothetical protein P175DRAFT_0506416 [Aspergillus ochraceoroseus IBT 24754]
MEKQETPFPANTRPKTPRRDRVLTKIAAGLGVISLVLLALRWIPVPVSSLNFHGCHRHGKSVHEIPPPNAAEVPLDGVSDQTINQRVPFEAHIMSKCPDARDCIRQLVVPAMEQISDKVDFQLSFIASVSNKSSDVECKHGPAECIGDMLMLCAANLPFPPKSQTAQSSGSRTPVIRSLGFATCLITDYTEIPDRSLVEQCALEHGIDFEALNECASAEDDGFFSSADDEPRSGVALLRNSALHSAELGIQTSCTVRLDDAVWCVRDDGVWKDCAKEGNASKVSVLVQEIERLWKQRN